VSSELGWENQHMDSSRRFSTADKLWSKGQKDGFRILLEIAEVFFETDWSTAGLRPRLDPLIVGPTGVGKSHLVRVTAKDLGIPQLRLTYNEWIVSGARDLSHTLVRIRDFVQKNDRGIIHVDELDKFKAVHRSDWSTAVFGELFHLLDRSLQQPTRAGAWTFALQSKLSTSFLIVGSGTWQSIWNETSEPEVGFRTSTIFLPRSVQHEIDKSSAIPDELRRRFSSELIVLPHPTEDDYRSGAKEFGLDLLAVELKLDLDYADAARQGLGARWLEECFARLLRTARRQGKKLFPLRPLTATDSDIPPDVDLDDLDEADTDPV
jgi:hypothetical protein